MEIEPSSRNKGKKLWNTVRILFYMLKKGMIRSKTILNHQLIFKRGKNAGKAMNQIMHHLHQDYHTLICSSSSTDVSMSIVPLHEYEFSCSNSPACPSYFSKLKKQQYHHHQYRSYNYRLQDDHVNNAHKVFDALYQYEGGNTVIDASSPMVSLPGFGHSPMVRQLRVTDSPFSIKDSVENPQVDSDCEEFINSIRKGWKRQEMIADFESASPYRLLAR